jgi:hypothetical protein
MSKPALMAASERSISTCGWLLYSAFAETFRAFGRIDFAARLRWLRDLREPRAITGGANNFGQNFTWCFHSDQSIKTKQNVKFICAKIAASRNSATKLGS